MDEFTLIKLNFCCEKENETRSEVVRQSIFERYEKIPKKSKVLHSCQRKQNPTYTIHKRHDKYVISYLLWISQISRIIGG